MVERYIRLRGTTLKDNRSAPQIDRDRVMYTSAFRRLVNVTQVVSADELHVFHNRLTHSLQVGQVARRCAELILKKNPAAAPFIDPDVCEAAALAHDIGHPPFGHLAEKALDRLAKNNGLSDGFEGNAQSFRIITKLAAHNVTCEGLDLTRATLNAVLKYPWLFGGNSKNQDKWGAYNSEKEEFEWARELAPKGSLKQSPEAHIMDWADDVTYSVHDVEDFYKAGLIPLDRLSSVQEERTIFCNGVFSRAKGKLPAPEKELRRVFDQLATLWSKFGPYRGGFLQRQILKMMASELIGGFVTNLEASVSRSSCEIHIDPQKKLEVFMLKQLTWHYVILNPALATQQRGQRLVIEGLFLAYLEALKSKDFDLFPEIYKEKLRDQAKQRRARPAQIRTIIDMIASMTESQAIHLYHRLSGTALGSALKHPLG